MRIGGRNVEHSGKFITMQYTYAHTKALAQEAFQLCLQGELYHALEVLHRTRNHLKALSGDLPIVGHISPETDSPDRPDIHLITRSFAEAQAWGWLEFTSGVFKLMQDRPGGSLVHFTRAWRIWRPWSMEGGKKSRRETDEAKRERVRAGLWLGEAWARCISDRASQTASAVLRAALAEIERIEAYDLLEETTNQQTLLPPASRGSPTYRQDGQSIPYINAFASR
jgi:hypothetical protein